MGSTKINQNIVVLISITSDIGKELAKRYSRDGYVVVGTYRSAGSLKELKEIPNCRLLFCDINDKNSVSKFIEDYNRLGLKWDILISCPGTLNPIDKFFNCDFDRWSESIHTNAIEQLRVLHGLYKYRNSINSKVVFFAGGGVNSATMNYSAYTISKIMLIKMCELLDAENNDMSIFIVGPGWVKTKIHNETIAETEEKAGSAYTKTIEFLKSEKGTSMDDIYGCIKWLSRQDKKIAGGRNFSVVYDGWKENLNKELARELTSDNDMYKLRRHKNDFLPANPKSVEQ